MIHESVIILATYCCMLWNVRSVYSGYHQYFIRIVIVVFRTERLYTFNCITVVLKRQLELLHLTTEKWHFISLYHHIGASNFIADCSAYPVTLPHTHRHNERVSSFYFGSSLVNCKSCQRLWLIVVFITILLSNQAPPQLGPELLNFS